MKRSIFGILLALGLNAAPASAQMAESLKSEFHKQEELGVVIVKPEERATVLNVMKDPKTRLLVLQLTETEIEPATVDAIINWVRAGHTVWVYDARVARMFGFQPILMKKEQFTNKAESGELGGRKYEGVATVGLAMGGHALVTGVGQVSAFLPRLGDAEEYGAVEVKGDTTPLLQFTSSSPAIAALRKEGRGLIVFKPLLWTEPLSGERFQSNLLEFSAGYQIPGLAGSGKVGNPPGPQAPYVQGSPAVPLASAADTAEPAHQTVTPGEEPTPTSQPEQVAVTGPASQDQLEVVGEGTLKGQLVQQSLRFETTSSSYQLQRKEVDHVDLSQGGQLDVVFWRDGHQTRGLLIDQHIEIEVAGGDFRKIERRQVRSIRWGKPGPTGVRAQSVSRR